MMISWVPMAFCEEIPFWKAAASMQVNCQSRSAASEYFKARRGGSGVHARASG